MDEERARKLVADERRRIEGLLSEQRVAAGDDRAGALEPGDMTDPADSLVSEIDDDEVARRLGERLTAVERAEQRLAQGTYGRSVRSGVEIPDERLEADPTAELTVEEAESS